MEPIVGPASPTAIPTTKVQIIDWVGVFAVQAVSRRDLLARLIHRVTPDSDEPKALAPNGRRPATEIENGPSVGARHTKAFAMRRRRQWLSGCWIRQGCVDCIGRLTLHIRRDVRVQSRA